MRSASSLPALCLPAIFCLVTWLCPHTLRAQEEARYNRFQYQKLHWRVFRTTAFSVYFPAEAEDSLYKFMARETRSAIEHIKKVSIKEPPKNLNIIVYPSIQRFYESNIGAREQGPFTLPTFVYKGTRVVVYYNGSYADIRGQLREGIARALWEDQVKGGGQDDKKATTAKGNGEADIPMWFREGVIRYFAHEWPIESEDRLRSSFEKNSFSSWQEVLNYQPRLGGEAFCNFICHEYYPKAIAQTIFQLKKKKSLKRAIRLITKRDLDSLYVQCFTFYRDRFRKNDIWTDTVKPGLVIPHKKGIVQHVSVSPGKDHVAYVLLAKWRRSVCLYNVTTHVTRIIAVYKLPPWIDDHSPDQYPLIQWHKDGRQLYVARPKKGKLSIDRYTVDGELQERTMIPGVDGTTAFQPLSDREFLLAAYRKGQRDIVTYNDNTGKFTSYTDDEYDDAQPAMSTDGQLFFTSNRPREFREQTIFLIGVGYKKDTLWQGLYTIKDKKVEPVIIDTTAYVHWGNPVILPGDRMLLTTTKRGAKRNVLFNFKTGEQTTLKNGATFQYIAATNEVSMFAVGKDSISITTLPLEQWLLQNKDEGATATSPWLKDHLKIMATQAAEDSILKRGHDTTHYFMDDIFNMKEDTVVKNGKHRSTIHRVRSETEPYLLQLHSAYFTAGVNNDYFINRYQPYATYMGQFKFPELGGITKGGFTDLFENHHFAVAFRLPAATQGSDFSVRYENTERNIDWGVSYFRKVETLQPQQGKNWKDENGNPYPGNAKAKTHYYSLFLKKPITYDFSIGFEAALRQDRTVFLATDKYSLDFLPLQEAWSINTLSFHWNKLHPTMPNLYNGFKADLLVDALKGFDKNEAFLFGSALNVSYHQPLYKYITLVAQFHAGYSGGDAKILYNLGGVNNNVTPRVDTTVHFSQNAPYAFQLLVTPLRGFYQNSLYGNEYALVNFDVYFPLFQTLIPLTTPLPFVNDLQLGVLSDIAAAKETWNSAAGSKHLWSYGISARSKLAGYPLRIDVAWPGTFSKQPVWYFSLSLEQL